MNKIKKGLLVVFAFFSFVFIAAAGWFYFSYGKAIFLFQSRAKSIAREADANSFKEAQTSLVYAADGSLLSVLRAEKDVYYLDYPSIPQAAVDAMLATEDRKFYQHGGFDFFANVRASIALIKNKGEIHQGASTITQQLARTVFLTNEVTWERKITELFLAAELEKKYTKNQIMEFYLNNIYFANGHYGIQAAANGYFGKSAGNLTISEIAFLCAIPNNPTLYDPIVHYNSTLERRNKVLIQMKDEGFLTEEEYRKAVKEKIKLNVSKTKRENYAESFTYYCAIRAIMADEGFVFKNQFKDNAEHEAYLEQYYEAYYRIQKILYTKGYRIYTSLDLEKHKLLSKALSGQLEEFSETGEDGVYKLQGSAVCIDNDTGRVVALAGGREQEFNGYTLNRAYQSFRQPGSAIKPLIVYTPIFERGIYPDELVFDKKFDQGPRNADDSYAGEMSIRRAVEVSKNTVAWKLFLELTPYTGLSYLLKMNFLKIVKEDYVPAVSIGGFTYGVSSLEMASAYAALASGGIYREPTCIVSITDARGNKILETKTEGVLVYEKNAALIMTDVLKGVITNGTGKNAALSGMISAGKTGTTLNQRDGWFCGYTKYYTTAVWVGYDMPKRMEGLAGNTYPIYIYKEFMEQIHKGLPKVDFEEYVDTRSVSEQIWGGNKEEEALKETEEAVLEEEEVPEEVQEEELEREDEENESGADDIEEEENWEDETGEDIEENTDEEIDENFEH